MSYNVFSKLLRSLGLRVFSVLSGSKHVDLVIIFNAFPKIRCFIVAYEVGFDAYAVNGFVGFFDFFYIKVIFEKNNINALVYIFSIGIIRELFFAFFEVFLTVKFLSFNEIFNSFYIDNEVAIAECDEGFTIAFPLNILSLIHI